MMKKFLKQLLVTLSVLAVFVIPTLALTTNQLVLADAKDAVCQGAGFADGKKGASCEKGAGESKINSAVNTVINLFSWIVGIVAVFAVIFGGFQYVTSAGDASKAEKGRNTILYAVIGLIIVALAQVIVIFVIGSV